MDIAPVQAGAAAGAGEVGAERPLDTGGEDIDEGDAAGNARPKSARIYAGTGVFVSRPKPVAQAEISENGGVNLNFVNARIEDVVKAILGGVLGQNYVFDEKVRGRVTMQTTRPLPRDAVASVLETALRQSGATLVRQGALYKIVPVAGVQRGNSDLRIDGTGALAEPGHAITIAPLSYVAAAEMKKILKPIAPEGGILHVDAKRNLLVLSGDGHEMSAMQKAISAFDVDWMSGTSFGLFPLEYVDAQTAFSELQSVLLGEQEEDLADSLRLVPIVRLNAVLAISPIRRNIEHVRTWLRRLDVPGDTVEQKIFLYPVQNGSAGDLAAVLNKFFGSESETAEPRDLISPSGVPARISSPVKTIDPKQAASRAKQSVPPAGGAPTNGQARRAGVARTPIAAATRPDAPIHIVEDEPRNALLISATTRDYQNIKKLLRKLDVPPLQVLIEATIAEIKLRDDLRYGLQWFFSKGKSEFTFSEVGSGAVAATFPGFSYIFAGSNARVAFDTLTSLTDVRVVSSPQLMVMNNTSARLQVGDQVPVPVQSSVGVSAGDAPIVNSIQFRDTGVILQVKPRVNESGMVTLEINQEVSDAAPTTSSGIDAPTIQQRQISSVVTVESGNTLALGGIIRTTKSINKSGLPILSEIPILGALFGTTGTQEDRTELLILLTPRVVRDSKEGVEVTEELRRRFSSLEPLLRAHPRKKTKKTKKPAGKAVSKKPASFETAPRKAAGNRAAANSAAGTLKPARPPYSERPSNQAVATTLVKSARLARPAGQTGALRPLGVRVGQHKTFTRLVFDWPAVVPYSLTQTDRSVTVTFARSARINLRRLRRRLEGGLANPQASNGAGRLKFKIEKPAGQKVRHFLVGPKVVLDFKTTRSVKRRMEASRKRPTRSRRAALPRAREKPAFDSPIIRVKAAMVQPVPATSALPPPRSGGGPDENLSMPDGFWSAMSVEEQIYGTD